MNLLAHSPLHFRSRSRRLLLYQTIPFLLLVTNKRLFSSNYLSPATVTVADPETSERGGPRNMKYKPPSAAAIFV